MIHSPAQVFASNLIAQLASMGVEHFFLSPGARSQALAVAVGQLEDVGRASLHVRLDERSSAFQALGVGKASGFPAAIITTSGTAVANLHPAVLEAHHSGVPMLLLTADRPLELRGTGSNQTTNQVDIFGEAVRICIDVPAPAETESPESLAEVAGDLARHAIEIAVNEGGPVHLNLCFREPLSAAEPSALEILETLTAEQGQHLPEGDSCGPECQCGAYDADDSDAGSTVVDLNLNTVVVAGDGGDLARWYTLGLPLLAEPSSGVRDCAEFVERYPLVLQNEPALVSRVEQILVFGKPTLSRAIQKMVRRPGVRLLVDPGAHDVFMPAATAETIGNSVTFIGEPSPDWLEQWQAASTRVQAPESPEGETISRLALIETVLEAARPEEPVVLGASRLIRELDNWGGRSQHKIFANRGLAGIDGTVATALGIAHSDKSVKVRVLLGDLTLLHDAGSLALGPGDEKLNLQIVVGNDNGGTIFEGLEIAKTIEREPFERLFKTPQTVNLKALAEAYGWSYLKANSVSELSLGLQATGRWIIEVPLN